MVQASTYAKAIIVLSALGLGLSGYGYIVKVKKSEDANYKSLCDLSETASCSRVLTSEYASGFGIVRHVLGKDSPLNVSNTVFGAAFFIAIAALSLVQKPWAAKAQVGLGVIGILTSLYLASLLIFVLKDFCLLCVSTYVITFINYVLSYLRLRALTSTSKAGKQKGQQKSQKAQKKQQNEKQKSPQPEKKKDKQQKSPQAEKDKDKKQKQKQNESQKENQKQKEKEKQNQSQNQKEKEKQSQKDKEKQKQNQNQQNGKIKNQQNEKQKSPKSPSNKKKNN